MNQMKIIDTVEASASTVRQQFQSNIASLADVAGSQNTIIDELTAIENELDAILPQYESYFDEMNGDEMNEVQGEMRNQVYGQAVTIDKSMDTLNEDLDEVRKRIDTY